MLKQSTQFEIKKDERTYVLGIPSDAPLGELHDVLFQMRSFVIQKINEAMQADQPKTLEEPSE